MKRFKSHQLWAITLILSVPVVVVAAVPNVFQSGTAIVAAQVNENFASLDARVTAVETAQANADLASLEARLVAVETAIQNTGFEVVMSNVNGPLPKSATFSSNGGPLLLIVSGSGFFGAGNTLNFTVQLDAALLGEVRVFTNETGSHKALVTREFRADAIAGDHTVTLLPGTGTAETTFDGNDYFNVTVVELPHL
jgi:hypothetical protein